MVGLIMSAGIIYTIIFGLAFSGVVVLWVMGIDNMKKNHPKYKGEDFLDEDKE
jgi:hypothetical protein